MKMQSTCGLVASRALLQGRQVLATCALAALQGVGIMKRESQKESGKQKAADRKPRELGEKASEVTPVTYGKV